MGRQILTSGGGAYIDNERGGVLVVQFTGHLMEHRIAILGRLSPAANVEIVPVRWSLLKLRELSESLTDDADFIASIPAVLVGYGLTSARTGWRSRFRVQIRELEMRFSRT